MGNFSKELLIELANETRFLSGWPRTCPGGDVKVNLHKTMHIPKVPPRRPPTVFVNGNDIKNIKQALYLLFTTAAVNSFDIDGDGKSKFSLTFELSDSSVHACQKLPQLPAEGETENENWFQNGKGEFILKRKTKDQIDTNVTVSTPTGDPLPDPDGYLQNIEGHFQWGQVALACG